MSGIEETRMASRASSIKNAILIAGPTASGKSKLALEIANKVGGVIVNADSMQVYDVLNVLTARPTNDDLRAAPHLLYGHVDPAVSYSTGAWLRDVGSLHAGGVFERRRPIFVGGTGLYFRALTQGLSHMPVVPQEVRDRWRLRLKEEGAEQLHRVLTGIDEAVATKLKAGDGQRIVRALEVLEASGRSILDWQSDNSPPLVDRSSATHLLIEIDRSALVDRIDRRFDAMLEEGALEEVKALLDKGLNSELPVMRAIGVAELGAFVRSEVRLEVAVAQAKAATRQYAKRQVTFFRNQLGDDWKPVSSEHFVGLTASF